VINKASSADQKIIVAGIKYAELFPSYNFTFTITAGN